MDLLRRSKMKQKRAYQLEGKQIFCSGIISKTKNEIKARKGSANLNEIFQPTIQRHASNPF